MLRTLLGIILLSIFVTPVFSAPTPLTPRLLSDKEITQIYGQSGMTVKRKSGSIVLFMHGEGGSKNSAICSLITNLKNYADGQKNSADINSKIKRSLPKGMNISYEARVYKRPSFLDNKKRDTIIEVEVFNQRVEIKRNNLFLNCISEMTTVEKTNISDGAARGDTTQEVVEKDTIEINTRHDGIFISISDFQSDRTRILDYGYAIHGSDIWFTISMGILL